jgi:hypothetical protein
MSSPACSSAGRARRSRLRSQHKAATITRPQSTPSRSRTWMCESDRTSSRLRRTQLMNPSLTRLFRAQCVWQRPGTFTPGSNLQRPIRVTMTRYRPTTTHRPLGGFTTHRPLGQRLDIHRTSTPCEARHRMISSWPWTGAKNTRCGKSSEELSAASAMRQSARLIDTRRD